MRSDGGLEQQVRRYRKQGVVKLGVPKSPSPDRDARAVDLELPKDNSWAAEMPQHTDKPE
jgi:hypothetical protein